MARNPKLKSNHEEILDKPRMGGILLKRLVMQRTVFFKNGKGKEDGENAVISLRD